MEEITGLGDPGDGGALASHQQQSKSGRRMASCGLEQSLAAELLVMSDQLWALIPWRRGHLGGRRFF